MADANDEMVRRSPSLRDQQKQETRLKLIEAADRVFHTRGYSATTIDDIAGEAGASRPTFYAHFPSKAAVAAALYANLDPEVRAFSERLDALDRPTRAEVRSWLVDVLLWFDHNRVRLEAVEQAIAAERAVAQASYEYTQQAIDAMPRYLARFSDEQRSDGRMRMFVLIMQVNRLFYFAAVRGAPIDRENMLDVLADAWWALLRPDAANAW